MPKDDNDLLSHLGLSDRAPVWRPKPRPGALSLFSLAEVLDDSDLGSDASGQIGAFSGFVDSFLPEAPADPTLQLEARTLIAAKNSIGYAAARLGVPAAEVAAIASGQPVGLPTLHAAQKAVDRMRRDSERIRLSRKSDEP